MTPSFRRQRTYLLANPIAPRDAVRFWNPYGSYGTLKKEPRLADLLADPIIGHVMHSDGIRPEHMRGLIADMRLRLGYL
ncbi:hypothetical protein GALL_171400 [mine drainage metagenome]|uniref:Uncharacterized protein n=1 Tax=mine drainage metagenome TaxID=410659 RepID=A0A1J5RYM9_9ZZZZ